MACSIDIITSPFATDILTYLKHVCPHPVDCVSIKVHKLCSVIASTMSKHQAVRQYFANLASSFNVACRRSTGSQSGRWQTDPSIISIACTLLQRWEHALPQASKFPWWLVYRGFVFSPISLINFYKGIPLFCCQTHHTTLKQHGLYGNQNLFQLP